MHDIILARSRRFEVITVTSHADELPLHRRERSSIEVWSIDLKANERNRGKAIGAVVNRNSRIADCIGA